MTEDNVTNMQLDALDVELSAQAYRTSVSAAGEEASCGSDWNTGFVQALNKRGLYLTTEMSEKDLTLYPDGYPYTAPRPTADAPNLWEYDTFMIWHPRLVARIRS